MTIPRMELMAFLLGARQAQFMADTLALSRIRRTIVWSDSMIVLQQIRTPEKTKEVFVENRLREIRTLQAAIRFESRYVNTAENPADLVLRGLPAAELSTCDLWWHASPFLAVDESEWPPQPAVLTSPPATAPDEADLPPTDANTEGADTHASLDGNPSSLVASAVESVTVIDGNPSDTAAFVWDTAPEGNPSSAGPNGSGYSFRFFTLMQRWQMDRKDHVLAASATTNPLDTAEQEASPSDLSIPGFVSFFHAAAREPNPARPPTTLLYADPPTKEQDADRRWIEIRALNVTWQKVQRIYFYVLRAVGAFLRLRRLANTSRTPLGIDFTKHFATTCRHASTDGNPSVHAFCGERLYTSSDMQIAAAVAIWQAQKAHPPTKDTRQQLQLVESHGILYVKGRLDRSSLAATTITPLYLPRQSVLTDLIIYDYHKANLHAGVTTKLANVRVRYWFAHGRRTVANAIKRRCFECRKMTNPAYSIPPWPALPTCRTEVSRPFARIGVDFYGPVLLKPTPLDGNPSKEVRKYYVCLFTCLSIRAVHCELMTDLSTAQFFHAFKRFAGRRSYPTEVLSDNGTTFLSARHTIRSLLSSRQGTSHPAESSAAQRSRTRSGSLRSSKRAAAGYPAAVGQSPTCQPRGQSLVTELAASDENLDAADELFHYFTSHHITWRTITERAAWKGGVYERMIGLVKSCLSKTLGRSRPSVDNYLTLLTQAEWVVNCRPISYIHNSERDFTLVRPIDFLIPTLQGQQPRDFMDPDEDANSKEDPDYVPANAGDKFHRRLLKDLEVARRLSDQFGNLWRDGYLLELSRKFGKKRPESSRVPEVGDIVLIYDENLPRAHWRYGLVMAIHPSSDGVIREASVRLSETHRETRRAVNHLYPLKAMLNDAAPTRPPTDDDAMPDVAATDVAAPGGPSAPEDQMGINTAQGNKGRGNPLTFSTTALHPNYGQPSVANAAEGLSLSGQSAGKPRNPGTGHPSANDVAGGRSPPDTTMPHTIEDRTSTEPTSQATASSSRGLRGSSGRHGPAKRRRW